jgi:hypothetical protein
VSIVLNCGVSSIFFDVPLTGRVIGGVTMVRLAARACRHRPPAAASHRGAAPARWSAPRARSTCGATDRSPSTRWSPLTSRARRWRRRSWRRPREARPGRRPGATAMRRRGRSRARRRGPAWTAWGSPSGTGWCPTLRRSPGAASPTAGATRRLASLRGASLLRGCPQKPLRDLAPLAFRWSLSSLASFLPSPAK